MEYEVAEGRGEGQLTHFIYADLFIPKKKKYSKGCTTTGLFRFAKSIVGSAEMTDGGVFHFLTVRALAVLHEIIHEHARLIRSNDRHTFLRGLGYHSAYVRDLCYDPAVLAHLRALTGLDLIPHYLFSNVGHVNVGVPNDREVDRWHLDSVPYVLVILLSDPEIFSGGVLEYEKDGAIVPVRFTAAGQAFFMKGSSVRHHVTRLVSGRRLTLINSYMERHDHTTNLETFRHEENFEAELRYRPIFLEKACPKIV